MTPKTRNNHASSAGFQTEQAVNNDYAVETSGFNNHRMRSIFFD